MKNLFSRVCIALGSNLGWREQFFEQAFQALHQQPHFSNLAVSSVYETKPVDSSGENYLNAAAVFDTDWDAANVYRWMMALEQNAGRKRESYHAPRTLDLDLLFFGEEIISTELLTVPHPRLHQRAFVLVPLAEIAPEWIHPVYQKSIQELRNALPFDELVQVKKYENYPYCETLSKNA